MTLLDHAPDTVQAVGLRRLDTGVTRLAGSTAVPVILLPDLPADVVAALAPLLARRREVFAGDLAEAPGVLGSSRVVVVGGTRALAVGTSHPCAGRLEALVGVDASDRVAAASCPTLIVLTMRGSGSSAVADAAPAPAPLVAASGHPVETAHLIDAFLRDPRRSASGDRRAGRADP